MSTVKKSDEESVFKQGDWGDSFYIIASGRVHIERDGRFIRALSAGDFFGDRALLNQEPRSASITASGNCVLWAISADTFKHVMSAASIQYLKGRMNLQDTEYKFSDLQYIRVIGTGGFGIVKMVQTKTGWRYALKSVKKQPIVEFQQQESLQNERAILSSIDHPFIIRLVQSFKNDYFVYFLLELVSGGELLEVLAHLGLLDQNQAVFYTASIIIAFEHLHERRIAYLDLKSENVLIDTQGFIKLVDFGLAVKISGGQCHVIKGTPHFMAPEMILSKGYDTTADLWALGVCVYEFMLGTLPFGNDSVVKAEIFRAVLKSKVVFNDKFRSHSYAEDSISLIEGLLQRKPQERLGGSREGYRELMNHAFFAQCDWDDLVGRKVTPPYIPSKEKYAQSDEHHKVHHKPLEQVEQEALDEERKNSSWKDPDPDYWDDGEWDNTNSAES